MTRRNALLLALLLATGCSNGTSGKSNPPAPDSVQDLAREDHSRGEDADAAGQPSTPVQLDLAVGQEVPPDLLGAGTPVKEIQAGRLPFGVFLSPDGRLLGRPAVEQDANVTLVMSGTAEAAPVSVAFRVRSGAPAILVEHPPAGAPGQAYEHAFVVADLDGPVSWTVRRGELPPGIELDGETGTLAGVPDEAGISAFVLRTESDGTVAERTFAIRVGEPILQGYAEAFRTDGIEDLSPSGMILSRDPDGIYHDYGDAGEWNGTFASGIAWRFAWLRTDAAKADLQYMLDNLTRFREVTGVPGLTCRGYEHNEWQEADLPQPQHHPDVHPEGHASDAPGYEGWYWNGDTSRDQVNGQVLGNMLIHDLAPDLDQAAAASENLVAMALHVWDNGMKIVDPDGEMTTYGDCSAWCLEGFCPIPVPNGFSALLTGSWFVAAAHAAVGDDGERLAGIVDQILAKEPPEAGAENPGEYDYLGTMVDSFYAFLGYDTQWYNLTLAADSFYTLARLLPDGSRRNQLIKLWTDLMWTDKGERNTQLRVESLANPWWSFLYFAGTQRYDADAAYDALLQLIDFMPPPRLGVDIHNSDLYPVDPDSPVDAPWTFKPLPVYQQCSGTNFVWARNPFALDCGGRAGTHWAGTDFVAPYWLGVAHGYVGPEL